MNGVPEFFCWSKVGDEAGEAVARIVARKERSRAADEGMFLWGIGQQVEAAVRRLVDATTEPQVLFTPMPSKAKAIDSNPSGTTLWRRAVGMDGSPFSMPAHSRVTSRSGRNRHWALVCHSATSLDADDGDITFRAGEVFNLGSGATPGGSQVTTTVQYKPNEDAPGAAYQVLFRAKLVTPYVARLQSPVEVPSEVHEAHRRGDDDALASFGDRIA